MSTKFYELKDLIELISIRSGNRLQIHPIKPEIIQELADYYGLHVFTPEDHPTDFYFCRGYFNHKGEVVVSKHNAYGSFSLTSLTNVSEHIENESTY
jgi:hypothetical protein